MLKSMAAHFEFSGGTIVAHVYDGKTVNKGAACNRVTLSDDELEYVRATFPDIPLGTKRVVTIEGADAQKIAEEWGRE